MSFQRIVRGIGPNRITCDARNNRIDAVPRGAGTRQLHHVDGTEITDACYRCGYSLNGIGDATPCPECGLLARRSRRTTDELRYTRPRWLKRISRGTSCLLLAVAL